MRAQTLDTEFVRTLFFTEFKTSRWRYLEQLAARLQISQIIDSPRNEEFIEPPEANRPPFDRVPYEYRISYNNMGYRDTDFQLPKRSGIKRIVVLGDSVAFGKGVEHSQSFPELLESWLENVEVFNLGLQGCTSECKIQIFNRSVDVMSPDLILIQASGNDIDQTLWKESYANKLPGMGIVALEKTRRSFLLQTIMHWRGEDRISHQMKAAAKATKTRYQPYLQTLFDEASKRNIPIVSVNLPFAYGQHYGDHLSDLCTERPDVCVYDLKMRFGEPDSLFEKYPIPSLPNKKDFVDLTADEMNISSEELSQIFEYRPYFHDVCHLSPLGHLAVADTLLEPLKDRLK